MCFIKKFKKEKMNLLPFSQAFIINKRFISKFYDIK